MDQNFRSIKHLNTIKSFHMILTHPKLTKLLKTVLYIRYVHSNFDMCVMIKWCVAEAFQKIMTQLKCWSEIVKSHMQWNVIHDIQPENLIFTGIVKNGWKVQIADRMKNWTIFDVMILRLMKWIIRHVMIIWF